MGPPPPLPGLRSRRLLRQLAGNGRRGFRQGEGRSEPGVCLLLENVRSDVLPVRRGIPGAGSGRPELANLLAGRVEAGEGVVVVRPQSEEPEEDVFGFVERPGRGRPAAEVALQATDRDEAIRL